ncbi:MAG: ABC transporter permease [Bacteroidetes bacterium]|nr:ABC transporter permease [Bacteroidota bacterium]
MIRNLLTVAWRNITRQWMFSLINIVGLAVGIACSLVIFLFVYGEWSYDRAFAKSDRVYRIGISFFNIGRFANGPERLLEILPKEFPGLESATRIQKDLHVPIARGESSFLESEVYYADSAFFRIFDFRFLAGNPDKILTGANEIVLSESAARKYFGKTDVLGETLLVGKDKKPYQVTGIVADPNFNTSFTASCWLSVHSRLKGEPVWTSAAFYNYVLLKEHVTASELETALAQVLAKYVYPESGRPMGFRSLEDYLKNENAVHFYAHQLKDIHLKSDLNFELSPGGNESNTYIFGAIALFILLLAGVNFINLTTARAARRAREVGIRKLLGTSRLRLIMQFMLESIATSVAGMILALVLAELFLLAFLYVTGHPLMDTIWRRPGTVMLFAGFSLIVGLLSGIYPSWVLSSFLPARVLKGQIHGDSRSLFRNGLVVFQFTVSIALMICALTVQRQMQYMSTKDLGFDQQNVLVIDGVDKLGEQAHSYRNELAAQTKVVSSSFYMGEPGNKDVVSIYTYQTPVMQHSITIPTYFGDENYLTVMGIRLLKGRNFSKELASDTASVIFNEAAAKALGLGDEPVGATLNDHLKVIGITHNFHWESLRTAVAPTAIIIGKEKYQLGLRTEPGATHSMVELAERKWTELKGDEPFRYHFLEDNFGKMLKQESVLAKAINLFTFLAMFISCLGLYGLSAYTAEQRVREIGIRKIMGAGSSTIMFMLNQRFSQLVLLGAFVGIPSAVFLASRWLDGFAYHVEISAISVAISVVASILIAWIAVGYHALRAASMNPVDSLRHE